MQVEPCQPCGASATLYPKWTTPYQAQASFLRQFPLHLGNLLDTLGQLRGSKSYYSCVPERRAVLLSSASPLAVREDAHNIQSDPTRQWYCTGKGRARLLLSKR
jgi:hypothetical protein